MYIKVRAIAGARKELIVQDSKLVFSIQVREPAERNMANKRIRQLLCEWYTVEKGSVQLITGHHSPSKIFDITLKD